MKRMNCSQISRKLSAFMDGELDDQTSSLIGQHIERCPECQEYFGRLRKMDALVCGLPNIEPGTDFTSRVVSAAMRPPAFAGDEPFSFASGIKLAVTRLFEAIFSLFEPGSGPSTGALDEFSDSPPLSMSFIYFKLVDQGSRGY
jgi:anti-sigma factor RsiW